MEILSLKNLGKARERFQGFSAVMQACFILSAVFSLFWLAAIFWLVTKDQAEFLVEFQIDKIIHFAGGFFSVSMVFLAVGNIRRRNLIALVFVIGILWEIWELLFLPDQLARFHSEFAFWAADSFFDLVADILGAYFSTELNKGIPGEHLIETE